MKVICQTRSFNTFRYSLVWQLFPKDEGHLFSRHVESKEIIVSINPYHVYQSHSILELSRWYFYRGSFLFSMPTDFGRIMLVPFLQHSCLPFSDAFACIAMVFTTHRKWGERGILGLGVFLLQYSPLFEIWKLLHYKCNNMKKVG